MEVSLVFPHQLFNNNPAISRGRTVVMFQDPLFFTQYNFLRQKLIFHRASMKAYAGALDDQGILVKYFDGTDKVKSTAELFAHFSEISINAVHTCEPDDYLLKRRLQRYAEQFQISIIWYRSPGFLFSKEENSSLLAGKKSYHLTSYYIHWRKERNILIDKGKPLGGKWTYDTENRKPLAESIHIPQAESTSDNHWTREAASWVDVHFPTAAGTGGKSVFGVSRNEALDALQSFLKNRFSHFGHYQDAIHKENPFLFHAMISPALNAGLITPDEVVEKAIEFADHQRIPLNALEGFIRQVLGWREFIRAVYHEAGVRQRTSNFWEHHHPLPSSFYTGKTGIAPVDGSIRHVLKYGYTNHIERLMILGNFMLLCGIRPDDVYRWFMELFIDAYDWVMVPNVYGMSQFADGGLMCTKPYISGSAYIKKMSNYSSGPWTEIWDALYWNFVGNNRDYFKTNPRMAVMAASWDRFGQDKQDLIRRKASGFLENLFCANPIC